MFSYRCPACGKQHQVESPFQDAYDAPCLRCREVVHVTRELVGACTAGVLSPGPNARRGTRLSERIRPAAAPGDHTGPEPDGEQPTREDIDDAGALEKGYDADWAVQEAKKNEALVRAKDSDDPNEDPGAAGKGKKRKSGSKDKPELLSPLEKGRRRWLVITSVGVLVLALLGAGGYFGYDYYRRNKTSSTTTAKAAAKDAGKTKTTAAETKVASAKKSSPPAATKDKPKTVVAPKDKSAPSKGAADKGLAPDKPELVEPIIKARDDKVIRISAARLSFELAANRAVTNEKYKGALLELSGTYAQTEIRETVRPPKRPHIVFACEGPPIIGDLLGSHTEPLSWARLVRQRPCTIRGTYGGDGVLHGCDLMPVTPPADADYKGKDIEVTGYVAQVVAADRTQLFPRIVLESSTNSLSIIECLFRKNDEDKVLSVGVDSPVTIRGICGGRFQVSGENRYLIRLDNCELLETTAPTKDRPRLDAIKLLHAYEEDLRPVAQPPPMLSTPPDPPLALALLEAEFALDPKSLGIKYRHKCITVEGIGANATRSSLTLRLTTGNTNAVVAAECHFSSRALKDLDAGPRFRIQGFCSGLADLKTLVLENCEILDPNGQRFVRRLTADFFPNTPGRTLTYDVAQYTASGGRPQVVRMLFDQKDDGVVESVTTHIGYLRGSLFDATERGKWPSMPGARKVRLPGPKFRHRVFGGFVQLGQFEPTRAGSNELFYEPVLKLGARAGDVWRWSHANAVHEYKIVKFDNYQGQPSVIVEETVAAGQDPHHPTEIQHLYVRGVGEVERREYLRLTIKEKRLLAERRLVDEPRPGSESAPARPTTP